MLKKTPLKLVFIIPFVIQILGIVGIVGYLSFTNGQKTVNFFANQLISETGDRINQNLVNYLHKPTEITKNNAKTIQLGILNWQDLRLVEKYFWQQMKNFEEIGSFSITNEKKEILIVQKDDDGSYISRLRDQSTNYNFDTYLTDDQGHHLKFIRSNSFYDPHHDPPNLPWYGQTKKANRLIWRLNVSMVKIEKPNLIAVNFMPFSDHNNKFQGVIGCSVSLSQLGDFLTSLKIGKTGQAFIMDRKGLLIATSTGETPFIQGLLAPYNKENLNKNVDPNKRRLNVLDSENLLTKKVATYLNNNFTGFEHIEEKKEFSLNLENQTYFVQIIPSKIEQDFDWLTVIIIPQSDFMAEIKANTKQTIVLCIIALIISIYLGIKTANYVIKPILKLNKASKEIAQGNWHQTIEIHRNDEVGELGNAFNLMAQQLQEYVETLELKVQARTQELANSNQQLEQILEALAEKERILATLMRNLPGMAYRCINEKEWRMLFVSQGCSALTGYNSEDIISGKIIYNNLILAEDQDRIWQEVQTALKQNIAFQLNYRILTANHRVKWCWEQGQGIYDQEGNLLFLEGFISDITERKNMEIALEKSKEKAEVANKAKSVFIANMSHELRTPLNAILGFAQILNRSVTLSQEDREYINIINRSGEYLLSLINSVLDLAKIEAGKHNFYPHNFDLYCLLNEVQDLFELKAESKGLQLIFERDQSIPRSICTDETKLKQVLINLLNNGIKFTDSGYVKLTVTKDNLLLQNSVFSYLLFTVEDTGAGIAENELDQLFKAFSQTESGKNSQEGTGLGLIISRQFVKLMGGDIQVKSELGKGTIFSFKIQVSLGKETEIKPRNNHLKVIGIAPNQPPYKILIAEDKEVNCQLLIKILQPLNFEVKKAKNGKEAIEIWENWQPHLIFMDLAMPVMDGYEATKYIKGTTKGNTTVIIAVTASVLEKEKAEVLSMGWDDFIKKPFQISTIFEVIEKYLGVKYIYEEQEPIPVKIQIKSLTKEMLAIMSREWIDQLYRAALSLDDDIIIDLIEKIPCENTSLRESLTDLVNECRLDKIVKLIENN